MSDTLILILGMVLLGIIIGAVASSPLGPILSKAFDWWEENWHFVLITLMVAIIAILALPIWVPALLVWAGVNRLQRGRQEEPSPPA